MSHQCIRALDRVNQLQALAAAGLKGTHIAARLGVPYEDLRGAMRFLGIRPATQRQLKAAANAEKAEQRKALRRAKWEEKQRAIAQRRDERKGMGLRVRCEPNYGAPMVRSWGAHNPFGVTA